MARGIIGSQDKLEVATSSKLLSSHFQQLDPEEKRFITDPESAHLALTLRGLSLLFIKMTKFIGFSCYYLYKYDMFL